MSPNLLTNEDRKQYKVIFSEVYFVNFEHVVLISNDTNSLNKTAIRTDKKLLTC